MLRVMGQKFDFAASYRNLNERQRDLIALAAVNICSLAVSLSVLIPLTWLIKQATS